MQSDHAIQPVNLEQEPFELINGTVLTLTDDKSILNI